MIAKQKDLSLAKLEQKEENISCPMVHLLTHLDLKRKLKMLKLYSNISAFYIQCFEQPQYYGLKHAIPQHPQREENKYQNQNKNKSKPFFWLLKKKNGTHIFKTAKGQMYSLN